MGKHVPEGDILIHAGDFTYLGKPQEVIDFNEQLGRLPHKIKIVIAGNHELSFDRTRSDFKLENYDRELAKLNVKNARDLLTNCIYLEDSETTAFGYRIYGSPWQPLFGGWAFNAERGKPILEKWDLIPEGVDILVTHGPPLGHGDKIHAGIHVGCVELLNSIEQRIKPKFHIFGHIHEDHGITRNDDTIFINASICDKHYHAVQSAVVFDLPRLPKTSAEPDA